MDLSEQAPDPADWDYFTSTEVCVAANIAHNTLVEWRKAGFLKAADLDAPPTAQGVPARWNVMQVCGVVLMAILQRHGIHAEHGAKIASQGLGEFDKHYLIAKSAGADEPYLTEMYIVTKGVKDIREIHYGPKGNHGEDDLGIKWISWITINFPDMIRRIRYSLMQYERSTQH
jgi:hypothetical protein